MNIWLLVIIYCSKKKKQCTHKKRGCVTISFMFCFLFCELFFFFEGVNIFSSPCWMYKFSYKFCFPERCFICSILTCVYFMYTSTKENFMMDLAYFGMNFTSISAFFKFPAGLTMLGSSSCSRAFLILSLSELTMFSKSFNLTNTRQQTNIACEHIYQIERKPASQNTKQMHF